MTVRSHSIFRRSFPKLGILPRAGALGLATILAFGLGQTAQAQQEKPGSVDLGTDAVYRIRKPVEPPPAKSEKAERAPSRDAIRIPGYWDLRGDPMTAPRGGWVWVPGRWEVPPFRHAHWNPGHWGYADEWWSWIPGHWADRNEAPTPEI